MTSRPTVVFLNRFYWPDVAATGQMLTDLAEHLAGDGWDVRVITSVGRYESGDPLPRRETHNGVRITRIRGTTFGRGTMFGRVADYASYMVGALLAVMQVPRGSIVVGMTDPPLIAALAVLAARIRGGKSVYWVQDVFPEIAVRLRVLRERGVAHRVLRWIAGAVYGRTDLLVALGPTMAKTLIEHGAPAHRTTSVDNWADARAIVPMSAEESPFVRAHRLQGKFVVLYSGNAGRAHTFEATCAAMSRLRDVDDIIFLFIGGGHRTRELQHYARQHGLTNALFLEYVPRSQLASSLSAASVSLVTEDPSVAGLLVPSKTYGILASGRPLLFVGSPHSDVAAIVRAAGCGWVVDPADGQGLTAAILRLRGDAGLRHTLGERARAAAENRYNRERSCARWDSLLRALAEGAPVHAAIEHDALIPVSAA